MIKHVCDWCGTEDNVMDERTTLFEIPLNPTNPRYDNKGVHIHMQVGRLSDPVNNSFRDDPPHICHDCFIDAMAIKVGCAVEYRRGSGIWREKND